METVSSWQEWVFVGSYLGLLFFVIWGVLINVGAIEFLALNFGSTRD
jgi:hypothetical protein